MPIAPLLPPLLLLALPARAHVPHDGVLSLVAPPTLDASAAWWIVVDADEGQVMMRSDDAGRTWQVVASKAISEKVIDMALFEGQLVYAAQNALWVTTDGSEWTRHLVEPDIVQLGVHGGRLLVATHQGVHAWESEALVTLLPKLDIVQLGVSDAGATAVTSEGMVYLRTEDRPTFQLIGTPSTGAISSVAVRLDDGEAGVLVGNDRGELRLYRDEAWVPCTQPVPLGDVPEIVRMAADGDTWMTTTGSVGPMITRDGCETWEVQRALDVMYGVTGSADTPQEAFADLMIAGDSVLIAGWAGIGLSSDLAGSWSYPPILPSAFVRAVAFATDFETSGRLWIGGVASNVMLSEDHGSTLSAPNHGQLARDPQNFAVDPTDPLRIFAVGSASLAVSTDGGHTWAEVPDAAGLASVRVFTDPAEVWVLRLAEQPGALVSEDGLTGWTEPTGLSLAMGQTLASDVVRGSTVAGERLTCVVGADPGSLFCREGEDGAWRTRFISVGEQATAMLARDGAEPGPWLVGDGVGVWRSTEEGDDWELALDTAPVRIRHLLQLPDDTVFAFTAGGQVYRSSDLGLSWTDLEIAIPGGPRGAAARGASPPYDQILVGSPDGAYVIEGALGTASLRRVGGTEIIDGSVSWWHCHECGDAISVEELAVDTDGAWCDQVTWLDTGHEVGAYLRGVRLELVGTLPEGASFSYTVTDPSLDALLASGRVEGPLGAEDALTQLLVIEDLDGDLVEVELKVEAGRLGLDYVVGRTAGQGLGSGDTGTTGDGGATDGGATDGGATDGGATDGGATDGGSDGGEPSPKDEGCGGCAAASGAPYPRSGALLVLVLALLPALVRRRGDAGDARGGEPSGGE